MASAPTWLHQNSSMSGSDSDSDSDSDSENEMENDSYGDNESTESLSSFDQSEEEDDLSSEGITEDLVAGHLQSEFGNDEEKPLEVEEVTDVSSSDLKIAGLTKCEEVLRKLSKLIWRTLSNSKFVSLLKDFVESEFFLIDGDSLFITCVFNVSLKEGQTLHFFYIVEQFLSDFIQKGARFVIVFFKDVENMYFNYPELLALRTTLIQHLEHNTDVQIHTEFSNCLSPEWEIFLKECYPYFLIITDKGITSHHTDFLNIFIIHALQKKINIVLFLGQETDVLRIYGYYAPSVYSHKEFFEKHEKQLQHALHAYTREYFQMLQKRGIFLYGRMKLNLEDMQKEIHQTLSLLQNLWPEGADVRGVVCSVSCSVTLKLYEKMLCHGQACENLNTCTENCKTQDWEGAPTLNEAGDLCRMLCLSVIFLQHLSLFQRAKSRIVTHTWDRTLSPFLRMLKTCEFFILKQLKINNNWKVNFTSLPDLTDKILWKNIIYYYEVEYCKELNLELGNTLTQEYEKLWNSVLTLSGGCDFGEPVPLRRTSRPFLRQKEIPKKKKRGSSQEIHISGLIPLKSELIEDYAGDILAELPFLSSDDPAVKSLSKKTECDEHKHWHSSRPLSDDFEGARCNNGVCVGAARFQLTHMGPYLFREERSDPDPRVHHFIPDTWQRELLDVVDNNESAVIVAPTSSGKTYASYYCMEKVLRESDEGVVVYVAPTKALVNQVVGTVCNLFNKALPKGLAVCGVFTRDYRHDTFNCQILVTVPQCFEILLLSPHSQKWVKRIRYVIFDEVHCLGGEIGAEVWEHLLVMIRCPFLALCATISNPEDLTEWLVLIKRYWQDVESTMEDSGASQNATKHLKKQQSKRIEKPFYRVRLVRYQERYNDLEKYVCSIKDNDFVIEHYHPCGALTVNHVKKYGIPLDLGLSPRESILLYDAMVHVWPEGSRMQELEPEEFSYFKNKVVILRADARKYEEELKKEMIRWIQLDPDKVDQLLKYLKPQTFDSAEIEKRRMFPCFVEKLKEMNRLPAIFFSFNIHSVEYEALKVFINLIKKQNADKYPNSERRRKNLEKKLQKARKSQKRDFAAVLNSGSNAINQRIILRTAEISEIKKNLKKHTEVSPDCTYTDRASVDDQTFRKIVHRIRRTRRYHILCRLLRRGIGYHHGSMEYKERQVVEMLFRMGHVKVVTATSSLALGINMPCKSVVFMEDSVYLDALNFRQMSGRAGRRGEDLIGSVFFYDVPLPKTERLLKSNVPKLKGQFPLSISLILRLTLLVAKADDKEDAKAKALSVLQHSLMSFKQPRIKCMLKFYFIYSLQFLATEGYLDEECIPRGHSGLVSHLHYHEPANFVLVSFLEKCLFHKLCTPMNIDGPKKFSEDVMETLVVVLAHLFGRRYLPPCVEKYKKCSHSAVILDDLPEDFAAVVEEHNNRIQRNFGSFLLTVSKLADMRKEYQLPLSGIDFSDKACEDSALVSHLMPGLESRTAVSPFACLSSTTDQDLSDITVVNDAMLRTLSVNVKDIPLLQLKKYDKNGRKCPLNGYALNFYKHGSLSALTSDNWLNMGDALNSIRDFTLVIQAIRVSLSELCDDEDDNVVLAFKQLSEAFCTKFWKEKRC